MTTKPQVLALTLLALAAARALAAPSDAFRAFVQMIRIDGVYRGTTQKIYVNKKVYAVGAVLDKALGIRVVAVDAAGKVVTFEDKTGERLMKEVGRPN